MTDRKTLIDPITHPDKHANIPASELAPMMDAAKARGVALGASNPEIREALEGAKERSIKTRKARADTHAANVLPLIQTVQSRGASLRQIATELNERAIKTSRGGDWHAMTVRNVLQRTT
jgi:hypothetical protein